MNRFRDVPPELHARERTRAIRQFLGCDTRGCTLTSRVGAPPDFGLLIGHNGDTRRFPVGPTDRLEDAFVGDWERYPNGTLVPGGAFMQLVPRDVAAWVAELHAPDDRRREAVQRAEIDADPWRRHAAMVCGEG